MGICGTNEVARRDGAAFEQDTIARQQNSRFTMRQRGELVVGGVGRADGVETHETQPPGELPEVAVEHEADGREVVATHRGDTSDINLVKTGEDSDPVGVSDQILEWDRLVIDQNKIDFRVGHAKPFNQVLH
jgi:hypothetical protein